MSIYEKMFLWVTLLVYWTLTYFKMYLRACMIKSHLNLWGKKTNANPLGLTQTEQQMVIVS